MAEKRFHFRYATSPNWNATVHLYLKRNETFLSKSSSWHFAFWATSLRHVSVWIKNAINIQIDSTIHDFFFLLMRQWTLISIHEI